MGVQIAAWAVAVAVAIPAVVVAFVVDAIPKGRVKRGCGKTNPA